MDTKKALIAVAILILILAAAGGYIYYRSATSTSQKNYRDLTPAEQVEVRNTLNAPGGSHLQKGEQDQALKSLTATSTASQISDKQRSDMLKSLQAN